MTILTVNNNRTYLLKILSYKNRFKFEKVLYYLASPNMYMDSCIQYVQ